MRYLLILIFFIFSGCSLVAKSSPILHSIIISNVCQEPLYDLKIKYGDKYIDNFPNKKFHNNLQSTITKKLSIPKYAQVEWRIDGGELIEKNITIRENILPSEAKDINFGIYFEFCDNNLSVFFKDSFRSPYPVKKRQIY